MTECEILDEDGDQCGDPADERRDPATGMTLAACDDCWADLRAPERQPGPVRPTLDDLGREAIVGTVALLPTVAVIALAIHVAGIPTGHADALVAGVMVGVGGAGIFLVADALVDRGLDRLVRRAEAS